jgi:hypothetical protein
MQGFTFLTAVFMKTRALWELTPFILVYIYWRFGRACCLHIQVVQEEYISLNVAAVVFSQTSEIL